MPIAEDVGLAIKANVAVIARAVDANRTLEKRLQESVKPRPEYGLLTSVPGIGQALATTIAAGNRTDRSLRRVGNYASYARCVDSVHTSNGKKKGEGNIRTATNIWPGRLSRRPISPCAIAPRPSGSTNARRPRPNTVVATKALAHKLARACYHILKEGKPFDVTRCFA